MTKLLPLTNLQIEPLLGGICIIVAGAYLILCGVWIIIQRNRKN